MSYRLESDLSREVITYLNGLDDCFAYVTHGGPFQRAGIPDVVGCYKGRFFGVELKIGNKYPNPLQRRTLKEIREAGGMAIVAWDLKTVIEMIEIIAEQIAMETNF